ncbi:hypothetical protein CR513_06415, partial [Mucuna pruriens]
MKRGRLKEEMMLGGKGDGPWSVRKARTEISQNYERTVPHQDNLMVVLVIILEYKVEKVLIDQGSSVNVLYWTTFQKLGGMPSTLIGFSGEQIKIHRVISLETTFGVGLSTKTIIVKFAIINTQTSYNIILGRPTLNRLRAFIIQVGVICVDQHIVRQCYEDSLKVGGSKGSWKVERVRIRAHIEEQLIWVLIENQDAFVWPLEDMFGIDLDFLYHKLSITPGMQPVCQKMRRLGRKRDEQQKRKQPSFCKRASCKRLDIPTVWPMICTNYTNLNKACLKDPYTLSSIDNLVDRASRCDLVSFMDAYSGYN